MEGFVHRKTTRKEATVACALLSALACGYSQGSAGAAPDSAVPPAVAQSQAQDQSGKPACANCGIVLSAREVEVQGEASGVGAVVGGVAGGLLGHQIGQGSGRDIATIAGAVGGAVVGHNVEKKTRRAPVYEVVVRMDSGEQRVMRFNSPPGVIAGDRVRVEGDRIIRQ